MDNLIDNKKTILIVGGGELTLPAVIIAKEMGLRTIVTDINPNSLGMIEADIPLVLSTNDIEGHRREIKNLQKKYNMVGVFTEGADIEITIAETADAGNLPGIKPIVAKRCNDKVLMREVLHEAGIIGPKFREVTTKEEIIDFIKKVPLPIFIKPVDNCGSRGVRQIEKIEDIEESLKVAMKNSTTNTALLEELLIGEKQTVEMLVDEETIHLCNIIDTYHGFEPYAVETGILCPTALPESMQKKLYDLSVRATKAVGINTGASKLDTIITKDGPMVIEMTARLSGGFHCQYLSPMALGTNDIRAAIKLAIGEKLDLDDVTPKFKKYSMSRPIFPKKGKVTKIEGIKEALKIDGVKHIILRGKVGDIIDDYKNCVTRFCFILAVADSIEEVNKICDNAENLINIITE